MRLQHQAPRLTPAPAPASPRLTSSLAGSSGRGEIERYIAGIYHMSHGASLRQFMPLLVSFAEDREHPSAALGLRGAAQGFLFTEQYLDHPAEYYAEHYFGQATHRSRILELGNLVGSQRGHAAMLYFLVGAALYESGAHYLLFCANRAVRLSLSRNGIAPIALADADPRRLGQAAADWGNYYDSQPRVMLGDVRATMSACLARPATRRLVRCHRSAIDDLAQVIQSELM